MEPCIWVIIIFCFTDFFFSSQVIDLLVRLLQIPLEGAIDQTHLTRVFKAAYDVLYTYMIGNSRKNALYFAKFIDFFQTQISVKVCNWFDFLKTYFTVISVQVRLPYLVGLKIPNFTSLFGIWHCWFLSWCEYCKMSICLKNRLKTKKPLLFKSHVMIKYCNDS